MVFEKHNRRGDGFKPLTFDRGLHGLKKGDRKMIGFQTPNI